MIYCRKYLLKEITQIQAGYALRGKIQQIPDGTMSILQMKDVQPEGIYWDSLARINPIGRKEPSFLLKGDIIFSGRGTKIFAQPVTINPDKIAAGPQFFVLTPKEEIPSEYISWYINSTQGQKYFWTYAGGSTIINVTRDILENFPIKIPSAKDLHTFTHYISIIKEEYKILIELNNKRQKLLEAIVLKEMEAK
ncbi:MAG: restriction endonuclease subunit S [Spirochaetales bacterium]|nr:restriction endonuclease subunit S [Spirochaetales bacterium]